MNQIASAAELALTIFSKPSSWTPEPVYDHDDQRFLFETIKGQFLDEALRAEAAVIVMVTQWALTGKSSKQSGRAAYFLNEILTWAAAKKDFVPEKDFPTNAPPWAVKYVVRFLDRTVLLWYRIERDIWAREWASDAFDTQERHFADMHPFS